MVRAAFTSAAIAALWTAVTTINLYCSFMNLEPGAGAVTTTTTPAQASASVGDVQIFLTFIAAGGLCTAVAIIYRRLLQVEGAAAAAAAGGGNRRLSSDLMAFVFAAAGLLELLLFVPCAAGGAVDVVVGEIGMVAFRALPAAATATFFLGLTLTNVIVIAHVRAGGEGGGGAFAGDRQIRGLVSLLTKLAYGAAAALVFLMALALYSKY